MLQCCQNWRTDYVIALAIKRTAPRTELSVEHFRGRSIQAAFAVCIDMRRENGGGFQRGQSPFGTRLLERSGKSLVCYTFCPGWCGKGDGRQDSRFLAPGKQAEEWSGSNHSSACFRKGQKVYTAPVPRPPSGRSDINAGVCAADYPMRPAPFSLPVSPSNGSAPLSPGWDARLHR